MVTKSTSGSLEALDIFARTAERDAQNQRTSEDGHKDAQDYTTTSCLVPTHTDMTLSVGISPRAQSLFASYAADGERAPRRPLRSLVHNVSLTRHGETGATSSSEVLIPKTGTDLMLEAVLLPSTQQKRGGMSTTGIGAQKS